MAKNRKQDDSLKIKEVVVVYADGKRLTYSKEAIVITISNCLKGIMGVKYGEH